MTTNTVQIADLVALQEQAALVEFYRNRSLIQAQALADATAEIERLKALLPAHAPAVLDAKEGE